MRELTQEELATNAVTREHIQEVAKNINVFVRELLTRGERHDLSKLDHPEVEGFTEYTPKLGSCEYGSAEYFEFLKGLKPALDHHYSVNRHHPQHHENGIDDM